MRGSASESCKINGKEIELIDGGIFYHEEKIKLGENKIKVEIDGKLEEIKVFGERPQVTKPIAFAQHYEAFDPDKKDKKNILRSIIVSNERIQIPLNVPPIYQLEKYGSFKMVMDLADMEMDLDWIHYEDQDCKVIIGEVLDSKFPIIFKAPIESYEERWEDDNLIIEFNYKFTDFKVCLDPGHGGEHSGAISPTGIQEKDLNLQMAHLVREELQNLGVEVLMTREDDRDIDLESRIKFATDADCNLILSIHHNSLPEARDPTKERGVSCHYYHEQSKPFAVHLLNNLVEFTDLPHYGLIKQNLHVLREATDTTSVLVELGFLIHPEESKLLIDPAHKEKVSKILAKSIYNFYVKP